MRSRFTLGMPVKVLLLCALAGLTLVGHQEARACGGLFCNARPPDPFAPLPVAQNGENIVFSITPDPAGGAPTLVAHIQILYTGAADKFSWVVPVDAAPTLSTGTDMLFTSLARVTQPRFQTSYLTTGTCRPVGGGGGTTGSAGSTGVGTGGSFGSGAGGAGGGGVMVSFQGAVGPFDAAVIKSDDPVALKMWLTTNGYIVSDMASGLIDDYVRENKHFVALKLLNGVGVRSIQPIVLTFRGTEACVPLRLTAIAANPDMPVLVWVLSDRRVAPRGYREIKIDEMRVDWLNAGSNYFGPQGLVSQAANEAGGNAFVTEYAGSSSIARAQVYANGQINLAMLETAMTPPVYVQRLIAMGLTSDPLMLPLLARFIPMPDAVKAMNVTESQFYGNLAFYWGQFAFPAYDLPGLTTAINASIVIPRMEAQMMIDRHPYLTRLNTFISPEEMNEDPFFFETRDLTDVSNVHNAIVRTLCGNMDFLFCNAPVRLELPDQRQAWLRAGSTANSCQGMVPSVARLASLPAVEVAWERELAGEGMRVIDNVALIGAGIAANNARFPAEETMFPTPTSPGTAGAFGRGGSGGSGGSGVGGSGTGIAGMGGSGTGVAGSVGPGTGGAGPGGTGSGAAGTGGMNGSAGAGGPGPGAGGTAATGNGGSTPRATGDGGGCGCSTAGRGFTMGDLFAVALAAAGSLGLARSRRRGQRRA